MAMAAPHPNPIVFLVMSLLAAAAVANDGIAQTQGASARNLPRFGPTHLEVVLCGRKCDKQSRSSLGLCPVVDLLRSKPSRALSLLTKTSRLLWAALPRRGSVGRLSGTKWPSGQLSGISVQGDSSRSHAVLRALGTNPLSTIACRPGLRTIRNVRLPPTQVSGSIHRAWPREYAVLNRNRWTAWRANFPEPDSCLRRPVAAA